MIILARILVLVIIVSSISGCKVKKKLNKEFTFKVDQFCDLMNTNASLDCIDYVDQKTSVEMSINKKGIKFNGFIGDDDLQNSLSDRDDLLYKESCFEIFIDPHADGKNYYEIEINPLEAIFDYILLDAIGPINAEDNMVQWTIPQENLDVYVMGTMNDNSDTDKGWTFSLFVPWDLIEEGPIEKGDCMAYNFMRIDADKGSKPKYWVAQPTGIKLIHAPEVWPQVCF
ncbi:carbohydrate-binding family 9-like protein [Saprospiraceae bacterium]|nr:carbohydrate-binding family 9-like protein [Saprospiraceae bacterium]